MPLLNFDIFSDVAAELNPSVNPYVATLREAEADASLPILSGSRLVDKPGRWQECFAGKMGSQPSSLILEIGCHFGKTLTEMASLNSDKAIIGLDITFKRVVLTAKKIKRQNLENAYVVLGDARGIDRLFHPKELDLVFAFFPDPWNRKKKHKKKQLFNAKFSEQIKSVLKSGGKVWLRTDQEDYFQTMEANFIGAGFVKAELPTDLIAPTHVTTFEALYRKRGLRIFEGAYQILHD